MKATKIILLTLLLTLGTSLRAQNYWINPINQVPFSIVIDTTIASPNPVITLFNGEPTLTVDSNGVITWNLVSSNNFEQIFGFHSFNNQPPFLDYQLLFDSVFTIDTWESTNWDSIIPASPWIANRNELLTPGNMGTLNALDWYSMTKESAKMVLDPTVPIIEGEDMDFTSIAGDIAFDINDYLTNATEVQKTIDHNIYTFNKPDFKIEFEDGFIPWMISTKPFLPDSFTFDTYHDWLYEYFHPIATAKISQIISTEEFENNTEIFHEGNNVFSILNPSEKIDIELTNLEGKVLMKQNSINSSKIDLSNYSKGIYILNVKFKNNHQQGYKLFR